ncbi:MAG TPA: hypothetical protein VGY66_18650 [Gemmataceae bacterium]|nr:hypothetical protein [Gemmataceae bacterium]
MFTVRCPGCGKQHTLAEPVEPAEESVKKRCLRCGEFFPLTDPALNPEPQLTAVQNVAATGAGTPGDSVALEEDDVLLEPGLGEAKPKKGKSKKDAEPGSDDSDQGGGDKGSEAPEEEQPDEYPLPKKGSRWPIFAGLAAVLLLGAGAGAYFLFIRGKSAAPDDKPLASKSKTTSPKSKSTTKTVASKKTPDSKEKGPAAAPVAEPQKMVAIKLSAPRLAHELATKPEETKRKYLDKTLELSGLFDKVQTTSPPAGTFLVQGPFLGCNLGGVPAKVLQAWLALPHAQPFTVRGVFEKDGLLHNCELLPLSAAADEQYKGKVIEVSGGVAEVGTQGEQEFPMIRLERETNGLLDVTCLFPKGDEAQVQTVKAGTPVTIRGTCNGRHSTSDNLYVRLDNCRLVHTTAPEPPIQRLDAIALVREYEEDLYPSLYTPPVAWKEDAKPLSIAQLGKEFAKDGKAAFEKNYQNKILTITGRVQRRVHPNALLLESGETDRPLMLQGFFTKRKLAGFDEQQACCIQGLCTGMLNTNTLRLDNCEFFDPLANKDPRRLTPEHFPYKPGTDLTYDIVIFPTGSKREATFMREVYFLRDGGLVQSMTTHRGTFVPGKSPQDPALLDNWLTNKKTKHVRLPGPVYFYRVAGVHIEIGHRVPTKDGGAETVWEPVLKLGARRGDTWKSQEGSTRRQYTLVKFDEHRGRPCAIIKETVNGNTELDQRSLEIRHVYVLGLGEVEREEAQPLPSGEKKIISLKRLVEDLGPPAAKNSSSQQRATP